MVSSESLESQPLLNNQAQNNDQLPTHAVTTNKSSDDVSHSFNIREETSGYLFMLLGATFFSMHATCIRIAESQYHVPFAVNFLSRNIIHLLLSLLYLKYKTRSFPSSLTRSLNRYQLILLLFRGIFGALGLIAYYEALKLTPVGDAVAIFFLVPIFTMILSRTFLSEPILRSDIFAVILSLTGTFLIARSSSSAQDVQNDNINMRIIGSLLMAFAAMLAASAYTIIRHLGTNISFMTSILSISTVSILCSCFIGGFSDLYELIIDTNQRTALLIVFSATLLSFIAQCGLNTALQRARAGPAMLVANIEVPASFLFGFLFLNEQPTVQTIIGSTCIILAALTIGIMKMNR